MSIARHFKSLFVLALIGGLALGAVLADKGAKVDLGTIAGVKLVLAAPVVTPTPAVPAGLFSTGTQGTSGQPAAPGAAAAGGLATGRGTTGTVQKVDGQSISVTTQDGSVTKATVSATTTYAKSTTITAADIKVGDTVTVVGQAAADGTITATQVTVGAASQAAAIGADGSGRQGGAGATGATGATGGIGRTGGTGGQVANVSFVTGAVQKVDGNTLTVAVEGGQPAKVELGADTRLRKTTAATLADVTVGEQVTIVGQAGADGVVAAVVVQIGALR